MEIYVDLKIYLVLFVLIAWQMYTLLWATKVIAGLNASTPRLLAGALLGAVYGILADLASFDVIPGYRILHAWWMVIGISVASFFLAFRDEKGRRFFAGLGYYYLLVFLSTGGAYALRNLLILTGVDPVVVSWAGPVASVVTILVAAELGWGVVQRWVWSHTVYLPLEIELLDKTARLTALLDTGNQLRDPLTAAPVIVVGGEVGPRLLPKEVWALLQTGGSLDLGALTESIGTSPLAARFRMIPFTSLGKKQGLLPAFRPDRVTLFLRTEKIELPGAVVAFYGQSLSYDGSYQALLPPPLLHEAMGGWPLVAVESLRQRLVEPTVRQ